MKSYLALALAFAGCVDAPDDVSSDQQALNGDTWSTVEHNTTVGTVYNDVAVSPRTDGTVYVLGTHQLTNGGSEWILRTSADNGSTFSLAGVYEAAAAEPAVGLKIAVDPSGVIYAGGAAYDASGKIHWLLRRGANGAGGGFTNVINIAGTGAVKMTNIVFDAAGGVYVGIADQVYYSPTGLAGSWTAILDYSTSLDIFGLCATSAGVLATGITIQSGSTTWTTMATTNHSTWTTLDSAFAGGNSAGTACVQNGKDLFVSGVGGTAGTEWITRHALATAPTTWATIDTVAGSSAAGSIAAMVDRGNEMYETGELCASGICLWHTRREETVTAPYQFEDSDSFHDTTNTASQAMGIAYSFATGSVFVVGEGGTGADVRRL